MVCWLQKMIDSIPFLKYFILKESSSFKQLKKLTLSLFLFLLVCFGFWQVTTYYLFSGAYFWFVILSFGTGLVVYCLPFSAIILPILSFKIEFGFKQVLGLSICNSWTLLWAIVLIMDKSTIIYEDEGGVSHHYGNYLSKLGGGISYLVVIAVVIIILAAKYNNQKRKNARKGRL